MEHGPARLDSQRRAPHPCWTTNPALVASFSLIYALSKSSHRQSVPNKTSWYDTRSAHRSAGCHVYSDSRNLNRHGAVADAYHVVSCFFVELVPGLRAAAGALGKNWWLSHHNSKPQLRYYFHWTWYPWGPQAASWLREETAALRSYLHRIWVKCLWRFDSHF